MKTSPQRNSSCAQQVLLTRLSSSTVNGKLDWTSRPLTQQKQQYSKML